jgi:hypothetical protein
MYLVLDDFEDGDGKSCAGGSWSITASDGVTTSPVPGPAVPTLVSGMDAPQWSKYALRLTGTDLAGDQWAGLRLSIPPTDLSLFGEIDFWAWNVGGQPMQLQIAVFISDPVTPAGTSPVIIKSVGQPSFSSTQFQGPDGLPFTPTNAIALEFRAVNANPSAGTGTGPFEFWLDDVRLKKQ